MAIWTILVIIASCSGQPKYSLGLHELNEPGTPSMVILEDLCQLNISDLKKVQKTTLDVQDQYFFNGKLYTGWACHTEDSNHHKYRYARYEKGHLQRQIGYYADGQLDHDFRMRDGKSMGKERMWMADGHLYIDHTYSSPGVMNGLQRSWHQNHVLSKRALFEHGKLIYEELFDQEGKIISLKGQKPGKEE